MGILIEGKGRKVGGWLEMVTKKLTAPLLWFQEYCYCVSQQHKTYQSKRVALASYLAVGLTNFLPSILIFIFICLKAKWVWVGKYVIA